MFKLHPLNMRYDNQKGKATQNLSVSDSQRHPTQFDIGHRRYRFEHQKLHQTPCVEKMRYDHQTG
jgi:hypothetical protein